MGLGPRSVGCVLMASCAACGNTERGPKGEWRPPSVDLGGEAQVAGGRLRPLVWSADGEPPVRTRRFRDLERDEECSFALADDGRYRCFPTQVAVESVFGPMFEDQACNKPVFVPASSVVEPRYVLATHERGCASSTRLYELGPELEELPYSGPSCQGQVLAIERVFARGARIANEHFVAAAEETTRASSGTVAGRQLTAEDGAAWLRSFYDLERETECQTFETASGLRCVASPVARQSQWPGELVLEGEACWDLMAQSEACAPPRMGLSRGDDVAIVHEVIPAQQVRAPSGAVAACLEVTRTSPDSFTGPIYVFGAEIPAATLPEISRGTVIGTRLTAEWLQDPSAAIVLPNDDVSGVMLFDDSELGVSCRLERAVDDAMRCLPGGQSPRYFADRDCSEPLWEADDDTLFLRRLGDGVAHVYSPGEAFVGEVFRDLSGEGSSCEPASASGTLVRAGAELPPARFVAYTLRELP